MAPIHVCIIYDKPIPEYYAGEVLSGNVVVTLETPVQINDVYIKVKGKGEVKFTRTEGTGDNQRTVHYYNREIYINHKAMIFQMSNAETFGSGQNKFPFSVILPVTCAETFHDRACEVKYKSKAIVKCGERVSFLSSTWKESTPFTVHAIAPIPSHLLDMQVKQSAKKLPFCCDACICFSSGKISCAMTINKGGYISGEAISFNAQISNKTTQNLESLELYMRQTIVCISNRGTTDVTHHEVNRVACTHGIRAGADFTWPVSFRLPHSIPPTDLGTCRIILVSYCLEADIGEESGCCAPDVHFRIPFAVGSATPSTMAHSPQTNMIAAAQRPTVYAGFPQPLEPGYPPAQPFAPSPGCYPPPQPGFLPAPGGYPPPQPGFPPSQPFQPGFSPSQPFQPGSGYSPTHSYQPGYSPSPNVQTGYPSPQPPMSGFAPSCPTFSIDQPAGLNQELVSFTELQKCK